MDEYLKAGFSSLTWMNLHLAIVDSVGCQALWSIL